MDSAGESDASVFVTPATPLLRLKFHSFILSQIQMLLNQPQLTVHINKTNPPSFSLFSNNSKYNEEAFQVRLSSLWSIWLCGFALIGLSLYATRRLPSLEDQIMRPNLSQRGGGGSETPTIIIFSAPRSFIILSYSQLQRGQVEHVKAERNLLVEVDSNSIVKFYYFFQDGEYLYLIMELNLLVATLQEKRDAAIYAITCTREKQRKVSTEESSVVTDGGQAGSLTVEEKPPDVMVSDSNSEEMTKPKNGSIEVMSIPMVASYGNSLEAHAFLRLLATFGIASGFDEEQLFRLIPMVLCYGQTADLCRSLGLKTLIVIHLALRKVDPTFHEELMNYGRSRIHMLNLSHFKDDSSPNAWDYSTWISSYALFLEERLECCRVLKSDVEMDRPRTKDLDTAELLEHLPALQQLLFRVLGCQPQGASMLEICI